MDVYLMRHGEAMSREAAGASTDAERRLSVGGVAAVSLIGRRLRARNVRPDRILCSPISRAVQTAELIAKALDGPSLDRIERVGSLHPEQEAEAFVELVKRSRMTDRTLLAVGHQPLISAIATSLIFGSARDGLVVEPGTVLWIRLREFPRSMDAVLAGLWDPTVWLGERKA